MSPRQIFPALSRAWRKRFPGNPALPRLVALAVLLAFVPDTMHSAAPPAGTSIGNQASATYTDSSNTERTATSNVAITIVQQVSSFTLVTDGQARYAAAGGQVYFPHTLQNTGNGIDTFTLAAANASSGDSFDLNSLALYADANSDGLPDNATAITSSGPLAAGARYQFVAVGIAPGAQAAGDTAVIRVTAVGTATASPASLQTNTDTVTITADAVVNVTKAISTSSGASGSGPYTYTITYNNVGNTTATNVTLMDVIPTGMTYVTNTARWSVLGSGTALTDADGDSQGTSPDTIAHDYNITVAGRITANISRVQPGQSGTLTFQVNVNTNAGAGVINNTPTYTYDPGTYTTNGPLSGNTVQFTVTPGAGGVDITGHTVALAAQGSTVRFTNVVLNTGNASDTFNITLTNSTFPAGTTFTIYQMDGNTPLVDSSGDGIPDTGPVATNAAYNVIVRAVLPTGSSGIGVNYTAIVTATSTASSSTTDSANDILTSVTLSTVDISNGSSGGAGVGPEATAVITNSANPGVTTRFTLYVTNTSGVADTYNLGASTNSAFSTLNLPGGWSVVFRDTSEAIITSTGVLIAGTNKTVYADVSVPSTNAPGLNHIYFRALSPTTAANDTVHDAVSVNTVRSLTLSPNNTGQITPGGSIVFSHLLVNNGNVLEGDGSVSSVSLSLAHSLSGWSAVVYNDANTNGIVDSGDTIVTNLAYVSGLAAGLSPGEIVRLLVKVFAPPGAPVGAIDTVTMTATTANGSYTTTAPAAVAASDNATVISGDLQLLKEQALDANNDGTPDTAYSTADITSGAVPGKAIRYRITVSNNGIAPATTVKVYDFTPAYTTYTVSNAAATTVGTVTTAPAHGSAGALEFNIGTLNPGQSAVVTFGVKISQ